MVIGGFRVGPLLRRTFSEIREDNVTTLAASAAYTFFFSLFPVLLFLTPLLSLAGDKQRMVGWLMAQLTSVMPPAMVSTVEPILSKVVFAKNAPGLMSLGLVLAAWSGSNVFGTLMGALNTAYDVTESRPWITQQIIRLGTFVLTAAILAESTIIFLDGEGIANWIGGQLDLASPAVIAWKIVQYPVAVAGLVALASAMFYLLPDVKQNTGQLLVAATVTTILWIGATLLFRLYVSHFPPNPAYGVIGGIIILLTWMYYTMFVVLVGGELASELHCGTGKVAQPNDRKMTGDPRARPSDVAASPPRTAISMKPVEPTTASGESTPASA